jgi:hypothetical protein
VSFEEYIIPPSISGCGGDLVHAEPDLSIWGGPTLMWMSTEDNYNALNLGVEFFLLFTHQIQALLSFVFPFRSFFPISKRCNDWCPYYV